MTYGKPIDAPFNASQPSTVRSWVLQRRLFDNVGSFFSDNFGSGTNVDRYVTTPARNGLSTVAKYTVGPGTPVDTLINKPFYALTGLVANSPLGDPGVIMTLESNGYTAPLGAAGASVRWLNALRVDSLAAESRAVNGLPKFTFRGDARLESEIFRDGFAPRGTSTDLLAHARNNLSPPSAYVSTSRSFGEAADFGSNVYVIRPTNGIDVNRALGGSSPFPWEQEVAILGRVPRSDIRAVTRPSQGVSILNPYYKPR